MTTALKHSPPSRPHCMNALHGGGHPSSCSIAPCAARHLKPSHLKPLRTSHPVLKELMGRPGGEMKVGCWGGKEAFDGLVDEIRLSAGLRYDESFEVDPVPFEGDETTVHLWHANEGTDNVALDAMARSDLVLEAVDWVAFDLAGDEDAAE